MTDIERKMLKVALAERTRVRERRAAERRERFDAKHAPEKINRFVSCSYDWDKRDETDFVEKQGA